MLNHVKLTLRIDVIEIIEKRSIEEFKRCNQLIACHCSHLRHDPLTLFAFASHENVIMIIYNDIIENLTNSSACDSVLLEFTQSTSGSVSCLIWLAHGVLCVGFESGYVMIFTNEGKCLYESKYFDGCVQSIRSQYHRDSSSYDLWILYEPGYIVAVAISVSGDIIETGPIRKYKLVDHSSVNDLVISPKSTMRTGLMPSTTQDTVSIYVSGHEPALSCYNVGCPQQFQHIGKLGSYVKETVTHVLSRSIKSIFESIKPTSSSSSSTRSTASLREYDQLVASVLDIKDTKRRILRLLIDDRGDCIVMADSLARVLLFDVKLNCIIRIWKGVRDARIAWYNSTQNDQTTSNLAIYAPLIGIISIYGMRHGPCLKTIPIGMNCHIFSDTTITANPEQKCCFFIKFTEDSLLINVLDAENMPSTLDEPNDDEKEGDLEDAPASHAHLDILSASNIQLKALTQSKYKDLMNTQSKSLSQLSQEFTVLLQTASNDKGGTDIATILDLAKTVMRIELSSILSRSNESIHDHQAVNKDTQMAAFSLELHREILQQLEQNKLFEKSLLQLRQNQLDAFSMFRNIRYSNMKLNHSDSGSDHSIFASFESNPQTQRRCELIWFLQSKQEKRPTEMNSSPIKASNALSQSSDQLSLPFSAFAYVLSMSSDCVDEFHVNYIHDVLHQEFDHRKTSKPLERYHLSSFHRDLSYAEITDPFIKPIVGQLVLNMLIEPLFLDDMFVLGSFQQALSLLSSSTMNSLGSILQLYILEMNHRSYQDLIHLASKPPSMSIFHKLFRDYMLTIQATFSSLCSSNMTIDDIVASIEHQAADLGSDSDIKYIIKRAMLLTDCKTTESLSLALFDGMIRSLLSPSLDLISRSTNLEAMLLIVTFVMESLVIVNEQLERRTYKACSLQQTIQDWEEMFCKLRLTIIFTRRKLFASVKEVTVSHLDAPKISFYECLAIDTLYFVSDENAAKEHERRCLEVFQRKKSSENYEDLPWYYRHDRKWREILTLCESEAIEPNDLQTSPASRRENSNEASKAIKRKPVLLYFPEHNRENSLASHRTLVLAERWLGSLQNIHYFKRFLGHMRSIPSHRTMQSILLNILMKRIIPQVFHEVCVIDEEPALLYDSSTLIQEFMAMIANPSFVYEMSTNLLQVMDKCFPVRAIAKDDKHDQETPETQTKTWPTISDESLSQLMKWFDETISLSSTQLVLEDTLMFLLTIQLRATCRLRHFKLASVLSNEWFQRPFTMPYKTGQGQNNANKRLEFLKLCLRQLVSSSAGPTHLELVFRLGQLWRFEKELLNLNYLSVLLEKGTCDHLIEDAVRQIHDLGNAVDVILAGLRQRIGISLVNLDRNPKFGPLLSTIDTDTITWIRGYNNNPDSSILETVNKGKTAHFNVKSTRQLILLTQSLLHSDRVSKENSSSAIEKKMKCEALLSLCDFMDE